jgi:hypothetical protein
MDRRVPLQFSQLVAAVCAARVLAHWRQRYPAERAAAMQAVLGTDVTTWRVHCTSWRLAKDDHERHCNNYLGPCDPHKNTLYRAHYTPVVPYSCSAVLKGTTDTLPLGIAGTCACHVATLQCAIARFHQYWCNPALQLHTLSCRWHVHCCRGFAE